MKIYLHKAQDRSTKYMANITRIVENSLTDLGYIVESANSFYSICDIALFIRKPFNKQKRKGIRHILYQIELYSVNKIEVDAWYNFGWDDIWDSNKVNEKGEYVPIGYHPCLKFEKISNKKSRDIGLLAGKNLRRNKFMEKVKYPWEYIGSFDPRLRGLEISGTKINLNLHAYDCYDYVEWDRIGHFFANDCFFISEFFPCEVNVPMFKTVNEYNSLIEEYINNPILRREKAERQGKEFRENFDMRKILKKVL